VLKIREKSITVHIDTDKCETCETKACAVACKKYARGLLQISQGKPFTGDLRADEVLRLGTECLACEIACKFEGNQAIQIEIPICGLDEYLSKRT